MRIASEGYIMRDDMAIDASLLLVKKIKIIQKMSEKNIAQSCWNTSGAKRMFKNVPCVLSRGSARRVGRNFDKGGGRTTTKSQQLNI